MNRRLISNSISCLALLGLSFCIIESTKAQSTNNPQNWCQQRGGNWNKDSCQWEEIDIEEAREIRLSQECHHQKGIWQTLFEEIYIPKCSGGDVCLPVYDPFSVEYIEKGVVCTWYSDIDSGFLN